MNQDNTILEQTIKIDLQICKTNINVVFLLKKKFSEKLLNKTRGRIDKSYSMKNSKASIQKPETKSKMFVSLKLQQ